MTALHRPEPPGMYRSQRLRRQCSPAAALPYRSSATARLAYPTTAAQHPQLSPSTGPCLAVIHSSCPHHLSSGPDFFCPILTTTAERAKSTKENSLFYRESGRWEESSCGKRTRTGLVSYRSVVYR